VYWERCKMWHASSALAARQHSSLPFEEMSAEPLSACCRARRERGSTRASISRDRSTFGFRSRPASCSRRDSNARADRICRPLAGLPPSRLHENLKQAVQVGSGVCTLPGRSRRTHALYPSSPDALTRRVQQRFKQTSNGALRPHRCRRPSPWGTGPSVRPSSRWWGQPGSNQ
jgi:hypothetical protein